MPLRAVSWARRRLSLPGRRGSDAAPVGVLVVVGTRPEAIKLVPVLRALDASPRFAPVIVSTGQQRKLVDDVLALAGLKADVDLGVGRPDVTLNELWARVLRRLESYYLERFGRPERFRGAEWRVRAGFPGACLVHGDTSSAAAAALAAFNLRMPVAHIEAGLRTHSTVTPFPEELNRQLIARIATFHLAPTWTNEENLILEGVQQSQIYVTGNTGIDALLWAAALDTPRRDPLLESVERDARRLVVVTAHRRENWNGGLARIGEAVARIADSRPDVRVVLPLHPNPLIEKTLRPLLGTRENVSLVPAMDYVPFAHLLKRADLVLTDSGGVQEEAPALGVPVLVLRDSTERKEGVEAGTLRLVGTNAERIVEEVSLLLDDGEAHAAMAAAENPYGDGRAAERIVAAFEHIVFEAEPPAPFGSGFRRAAVLEAAGFDPERPALAS